MHMCAVSALNREPEGPGIVTLPIPHMFEFDTGPLRDLTLRATNLLASGAQLQSLSKETRF